MFFYITKDETPELMVMLTFGGICYFYTHFGEVNSILLYNK